MNKNAIQKFAVWARNELIEQVKQRAYQYGIRENNYDEAHNVIIAGRVLTNLEAHQQHDFVKLISQTGYQQAVEEVAYTWFNRFIALRFMEVNDYLPTHIRVFSDANGGFNPEILKDVLHLDLEGLDKVKVSELLNANQTEELYRYLLLTQCNALNAGLPEGFERLGGYTEMLLPNGILKQDSVLARLVNDIDEDDWRDAVQIIGWMYQYYNTEPKQAVFDGLKQNTKITKEKIPAATQLFTPDWIVRYMVENSLGRLWLESHPNDKLKANWKYYIDEAEQTPEVAERLRVLRSDSPVKSPEDIRIIDPCMGSGHILVYAFDVLVQIYESVGVSPRDAVKLILEKNIYGLDIDRRAYQLAYFSLMMKARQYNRRIFDVTVNVCEILESSDLRGEYKYPLDMGDFLLDRTLNTTNQDTLNYLLDVFSEAKEYGSLLKLEDRDYDGLLDAWKLTSKATVGNVNLVMWQYALDEIIPKYIKQAKILTQQYDTVVTNPPYMGSSGMDVKLSNFVKKNYPDSKNDLFAVFIERILSLSKNGKFIGLVTSFTWMFLASYKALRLKILKFCSIKSLVQPEYHAFFDEAYVPLCAFVLQNVSSAFKGEYISLQKFYGANVQDSKLLEAVNNKYCSYRYSVAQSQFDKLPGSPVAYWVSNKAISAIDASKSLSDLYDAKNGMSTTDNAKFLRLWFEVSCDRYGLNMGSAIEAKESRKKWFPYNKGGKYRKWYGNIEYLVNWYSDGADIKKAAEGATGGRLVSQDFYFKRSVSWSKISSGRFAVRMYPNGFIFDVAGPSIFSEYNKQLYILALLNSKLNIQFIEELYPTMNYEMGQISSFPVKIERSSEVTKLSEECYGLAKADWDSFEISWDFKRHPLFCGERTVAAAFTKWDCEGKERFDTLKANEEELNRIFIEIYGLQDELTPEVEDKDVTVRRADLGREIRSLISYAVGCMFGRYSLDTEGLVFAGGNWEASKYTAFIPDKDNILPICDDEYFDDDIVGRFVDFIRVAYSADTLEENLKYIADALNGKGTPREVIRNYFLNDFFKDHCKIYQKRPIYWLFDSGKKNGFKALVYLHRYSRDLLAKLRTDYVHEQQERYRTQLSHIASALNTAAGAERARLLKQQDKLTEQAKEIGAYEEKVHHLADMNIEIDLDDGVKKNYEIFADVLAKI